MNADLLLFLGVVIGAFSFPTLVGSFSSDRSPRAAIIFGFIGAALIVAAMAIKPGGYTFEDVPDVMVSVLREAFN